MQVENMVPGDWNWYAKFFTIGLIASAILLLIPILIAIIIPKIIKKPSHSFSLYIYSFVSGMLIILGAFGYMREALELSATYPHSSETSVLTKFAWNFIWIVSGIGIGASISITIKLLVYKYTRKKGNGVFVHKHHDSHGSHSHEHIDLLFNSNDVIESDKILNKKNKWTALFLLLGHRIPEGIMIGFSVYNIFISNQNISAFDAISIVFLITFVIHTVPEEIVFYYRQREMGISSFKATLNSILGLSLIVPFIFIGMLMKFGIENSTNQNVVMHGIIPMINAAIGITMIFTAFVEFLPEFFHTSLNEKKKWIGVISTFFVGVIFTILLLIFHVH